MYWIIYPVCCALLWGLSYTLLQPVSRDVSAYTVNALYGTVLAIASVVGIFVSGNAARDWQSVSSDWLVTGGLLSGYVATSVIASFLFLFGYTVEGVNAGVYTLISAAYPLVTFVLAYVFLAQRDVHLGYACSGMVATAVGIALLALSK